MLQSNKPAESVDLVDKRSRIVDVSLSSEASSRCASVTVEAWGERWLTRREREGVRSIADDRRIWRVHVLSEPWAAWSLSLVTKAIARDWFTRLCEKPSSNPTHRRKRAHRLAAQTVKNVLQVVRKAFSEACEAQLLEANPFDGLGLRRSRFARETEPWTVLNLDEQKIAASVLPHPDRLLFLFALGSGLRQSEQWALRLSDCHLRGEPWIAVRRGTFAGPTKGGRPRRIPLFGVALDALTEWLGLLPTFAPANPHGLVFPRADGRARLKGRPFSSWVKVSAAIGRAVRWHDLRHTCATSLLAGWWNDVSWTLVDLQHFLGHASITTTERYAHWLEGNDRLFQAARKMRSEEASATRLIERGTTVETKKEVTELRSHLRDLNSRPTVYETVARVEFEELQEQNELLKRALQAAKEDAASQRELNSQLCRTISRLTREASERRETAFLPPFQGGQAVTHRSGVTGIVRKCVRIGESWSVHVEFAWGDVGLFPAAELG